MQKLPIGKSDFKSIRNDNFYYIDKSIFIEEIINSSADVILLPRPRRFGKTLNLSMLNYFFDIQEESGKLFGGLAVANNRAIMAHLNRYPIIYVSFKDAKESTIALALAKIYSLIRSEFGKNEKIIEGIINQIEREDRENYREILNGTASQDEYENSLKLLSKLLRQPTIKNVSF